MMEEKRASAYKIKEKIFIQGYAKTTVGLGLLDGQVFVSQDTNAEEVGRHILSALDGAGKIIPHPTQAQWKEMDKDDPMLKAAKMKTWNAMMKASKSITIDDLKENSVVITPLRFGGTSGDNKGYHPLDDKAITCDLDPENLGRSLIQAFTLCE